MIDGHAILYRAFHALPSLATSKGQPVGAVFGFLSMLLRIVDDLKPRYLAVAFDLPKPTFRQKLYANYQAQRPEMAEELVGQVGILHQVLETMGIPVFEKEGYEADDVIGTLAKEVQSLGVIIVTGDRDMLQLIGEKVKVLAPIVGITKMVLYDEKAVEDRYGLKPSQWVDFKALVGDPSDNYPGVSGIGPKTAVTLLKKYGNLEKIYQNLNQLLPRQAQILKDGKKQVELAKTLAKIVTDVPVDLDLEECELKDFKNPAVEKLFKDMEFKSLWERVVKPGRKGKDEKEPKSNNQLSLI